MHVLFSTILLGPFFGHFFILLNCYPGVRRQRLLQPGERLRAGHPEPLRVGRVEDADQCQVQLLGVQRDCRRLRAHKRPARQRGVARGRLHSISHEQQKVRK